MNEIIFFWIVGGAAMLFLAVGGKIADRWGRR